MIDEHLAPSQRSFECRPLLAITLADLTRWSGGICEATGQGGAQAGLMWPPEVVSSPVAPVLSFLMGLQGRLDLLGSSVPARVQRPLVMG